MEIRKTKKIFREVEVVVECYDKCDKCGEKIDTELYETFEFEFEVRTGESYPSGGYDEKKLLDLCQECSKEAVTLLEQNGFKIRTEDWDY